MTFGAETGSVYAMGIQIGEYINSIAPDITCTVKVGAAASNLALLSTGETVIAHSQSDTIHEAIVGEGNFTEPSPAFTASLPLWNLFSTSQSPRMLP